MSLKFWAALTATALLVAGFAIAGLTANSVMQAGNGGGQTTVGAIHDTLVSWIPGLR